jgi:hypothetical protein
MTGHFVLTRRAQADLDVGDRIGPSPRDVSWLIGY